MIKQEYSTKEKRLLAEIKQIEKLVISKHTIRKNEKEARPYLLALDKRNLIGLGIIDEHLYINLFIDTIIEKSLFRGKKNFHQTKGFRLFNKYFLQRLDFPSKLGLLNEIKPMPKEHNKFLHCLNDLRNCFAHYCFPESDRREKILYNKQSIFKIAVFEKFMEDAYEVRQFLIYRAFNIKMNN